VSIERLKLHQYIWNKKKILRVVYEEWFERIIAEIQPGKTLELGCGPGLFQKYFDVTIRSDIIHSPWIDCALDATRLPFRDDSLTTIVMIDVFHHLSIPINFFQEATRVLQNKGKIIIFDVQVTAFSYFIYRYLHHEPLIMKCDPLHPLANLSGNEPFDSNQAITTLLFGKHFGTFKNKFPDLRLVKKEYVFSLLYLLSGGFEHKQLIHEKFIPLIRLLDRMLKPLVRLIGLRNLIVLEKRDDQTGEPTCQTEPTPEPYPD